MSKEEDRALLEKIIPIFPLPNVVLFPKVRLPLHIFEPRYRRMVRDAIASRHLIGMALLRGNWQKDYHGNPGIYPVGCVGEITNVSPLPDGRFNIVLVGLREYEVKEQILDLTPYRQARVLLREEPEEMDGASASSIREEILRLVQKTSEDGDPPLLKLLGEASLDQETWINLCSFCVDLSTLEKQSLLETRSLKERATTLLNLLRFKAAEQQAPLKGSGDGKGDRPPH